MVKKIVNPFTGQFDFIGENIWTDEEINLLNLLKQKIETIESSVYWTELE